MIVFFKNSQFMNSFVKGITRHMILFDSFFQSCEVSQFLNVKNVTHNTQVNDRQSNIPESLREKYERIQ